MRALLVRFLAVVVLALVPAFAGAQGSVEFAVESDDVSIEQAVARWASHFGTEVLWRHDGSSESAWALSADDRVRVNALLHSPKVKDFDSALKRTLGILNSEREFREELPLRLYIFEKGRYRAVVSDRPL